MEKNHKTSLISHLHISKISTTRTQKSRNNNSNLKFEFRNTPKTTWKPKKIRAKLDYLKGNRKEYLRNKVIPKNNSLETTLVLHKTILK